MHAMVVTTQRGSTYVVGPSPDNGRLRVARISDHPVRGTLGPAAFADDFDRVQLVPTSQGIHLECTTLDGQRFVTSMIVDVRSEDLGSVASA